MTAVNSVQIESDANLYAQPAKVGKRFVLMGAGMTELTFQNTPASAIDPNYSNPIPGKDLTFNGKDLNADSLRMYPVMAAVQKTGTPFRGSPGAVVKNYNWFTYLPGHPVVVLFISYHPGLGGLTTETCTIE